MKKWKVITTSAVLMTGICFSQAQAGSVWLEPSTQDVLTNSPASLDLWVDFSDEAALGGGVDVFYDISRLTYVDTVFNDAVFNPAIPTFDLRLPDTAHGANELHGLSFGDGVFGINGPYSVATINFMTTEVTGEALLTIQEATDPTTGGTFISFATNDPFTTAPSFVGASVNVVPEMEVWAMMLAGMGLLGWKARRSQQRKEDDEALPA